MKKIINVIKGKHERKKSSSVVRREKSEELKILEAKKELLLLEREIASLKNKSNTTEKFQEVEQTPIIEASQEIIIPAIPIPYEKVLPENLPYKKPIVEISEEERNKIILNPNFDNIPVVCPSCRGKLKRKKIVQEGNILKQFVRCKKRCGFEKELVFHL